jgi:hypothetical protein
LALSSLAGTLAIVSMETSRPFVSIAAQHGRFVIRCTVAASKDLVISLISTRARQMKSLNTLTAYVTGIVIV